jgi:hypothetical protein
MLTTNFNFLGYGFLSENTLFVAELEKAGVKFIGKLKIGWFCTSTGYFYTISHCVS